MKKLLILLILLFALPAYAQQCSEENPCPQVARLGMGLGGSVPVAAVSPCPTGYASATFSWNGDHTTDTDTGCNAAGDAVAGTIAAGTALATTYGQPNTTYGAQCTAPDENIQWTVDMSATKGTIWLDLYVASCTASTIFLEYNYDSSDKFYCRILSDTSPSIVRCVYSKGGVNNNLDSTATIADGVWKRIGYSWDLDAATDITAIKICTSLSDCTNAWETSAGNVGAAFGNTPTIFNICERNSSNLFGGETWTDNVYFISGSYQGAHP